MDNVRILTRTTAFGAYDGDVFGLVERDTLTHEMGQSLLAREVFK